MQGPDLSPIQRLVLAFYAFFAILFQADVAAAFYRVREARRAGAPLPEPAPGTPPRVTELPSAPPPAPVAPAPAAAPGPAAGAPPQVKAVPPPAKPAEAPKPVEPAKAVEAPKPVEAAKPAEGAKAAPEAAKPAAAAVVKAIPEPPRPAAAPAPVAPAAPDPRGALQLLAVLQREGRLVDFIEEDLAGFPDASIGAAARTVHAGCKRAIEEYFRLEPVFREQEGARVTVAPGFDPSAIRLTGNVVGAPPFKGALRHHGWRAREVRLPPAKDGGDPTLVAPAEVEL
ncbi:DUF2760 domain-containing protein [Anaeromyxobacter terrae]|uniref:DUF2760 domain-containing protein n=1 Tax=Anaeromyxobacter terrae TaxID=2925406 RepID=UPI001F598900|nr:DUF2760 domain-containing protein [Anaeromyxobacter sp. SG22]